MKRLRTVHSRLTEPNPGAAPRRQRCGVGRQPHPFALTGLGSAVVSCNCRSALWSHWRPMCRARRNLCTHHGLRSAQPVPGPADRDEPLRRCRDAQLRRRSVSVSSRYQRLYRALMRWRSGIEPRRGATGGRPVRLRRKAL